MVSINYPFSEEELDEFGDILLWKGDNKHFGYGLSWNYNLKWSSDFIDKYQHRLDIEVICEYIVGEAIGLESIPYEMLTEACWLILSGNEKLLWNSRFIEKHKEKWDWSILCKNEAIKWDKELIHTFLDHLDWKMLCYNTSVQWELDLLQTYKNQLFWNALSSNITLSIDNCNSIIDAFIDKWDWRNLSANENIPMGIELFNMYKDRWDWGMLSGNSNFKMDSIFIDNNIENLDWDFLSWNTSLLWSLDFFLKHESQWNFDSLSLNMKVPWSKELILRYSGRWNWEYLLQNNAIKWDDMLCEKAMEMLDMRTFSNNLKTNFVSLEFILKHEDELTWEVVVSDIMERLSNYDRKNKVIVLLKRIKSNTL